MKKEQKVVEVADLHQRFLRAKLAIMAECSGVPANPIADLRRQLRDAKAEFRVVKNTMAARAVNGTSLVGVKDHLQGQLAVVIGYDDPVLPAKIVRDFIRTGKFEDKIKFKIGVLDGRLLHPAQVTAIAGLPPKPELVSKLLAVLQGPIRNLVFVFGSVLQRIVGVLAAIQDQKKGEGAMATAEGKLSQEEFIKAVESMSVLELSELVKGLEERFGVTAAAPMAVAAAPAAGGAAAEAAEEKTTFEVVLASAPAEKKIQIIKVVRELTGLGLKEAKDLVEGVPKPLKAEVTKEEAETMKKKVEDVGGKVELK